MICKNKKCQSCPTHLTENEKHEGETKVSVKMPSVLLLSSQLYWVYNPYY